MEPLVVLLPLFVLLSIVAARFILTALYRRRVQSLMRDVRSHRTAERPVPHAESAAPDALARPVAAEIKRWIEATQRRRRSFLFVYLAAAAAHVVPGAFVLLLYVEPGKAPPLAVLVASALLAIPLLPGGLLVLSPRRSVGVIGTYANAFAIAAGLSMAVAASGFLEAPTPGMVLVGLVQTGMLIGITWIVILGDLRLLLIFEERMGVGLAVLRPIQHGLVGAIFGAMVAGAYGNPRAWALLAPFALFLLVFFGGCRLMAKTSPRTTPPNILLLRVFGRGRKAEALLSRLADRLSTVSTLQWVSSSDVAAATVTPRGMLAFLTGRLRNQFVATNADLDRVLGEGRDQYVDGSFRTHEIACFENGWRPVVQRLIREASVVLMDLRGFTAQNRGCVYELGLLVNLMPASRVMLLVDSTTDEVELAKTLGEAWAGIRPDSPNQTGSSREFHRVALDRLDRHTAAAISGDVLRAAASV